MSKMRDEFLSEEDLDLRNLTWAELIAYWNLWLEQAQATNDLDEAFYSHGVFDHDPAVVERQKAEKRKAEEQATAEAYARHPDSPDAAFDPAVWEGGELRVASSHARKRPPEGARACSPGPERSGGPGSER